MSLHFLPREIIKYVLDFLDNQDYLDVILSSKIFYSSLSQMDKEARKDAETCVKYRKNEYLPFHSKKEILTYAYKYQRKDLLERYSFCDYEIETIVRAGDLEALKKIDTVQKLDTVMTIALKCNHEHIVKFRIENSGGIYQSDLLRYSSIAFERNYQNLIEYLSRIGAVAGVDKVFNFLTLNPEVTKIHKDFTKNHVKDPSVTFVWGCMYLNRHTKQNLEILQLDNSILIQILTPAVTNGRLDVLKYIISKTNHIPGIDCDFPPKIFFYLLDLNQNRDEKIILEFLFRNPDQAIRLFNRFPDLKSIVTNEVLLRICEEKNVNRNLFYFLFRLLERNISDIVMILIECQDKEICQFLFSELERNLKEKFKDFLRAAILDISIKEEHRRIICMKYLNYTPLTKLVELV